MFGLVAVSKMSTHSHKSILENTRKGYLKYVYMLLAVLLAMLGTFCTMFSGTYIDRLIDSVSGLIRTSYC